MNSTTTTKETFYSFFENSIQIMNSIIYILIALAVFGFIWGIVRFLFSKDNAIAKKEARAFMMYGILTLFVMTSFWGLVNILVQTVEVENGQYPTVEDAFLYGEKYLDENFKQIENRDYRQAERYNATSTLRKVDRASKQYLDENLNLIITEDQINAEAYDATSTREAVQYERDWYLWNNAYEIQTNDSWQAGGYNQESILDQTQQVRDDYFDF